MREIKANSDSVFIERLPQETTFSGMEVSEKALTKNMKGVIKAIKSENDINVTIGDEVLVPHYGVEDVLVDGVEYALTKQSKLFAKKEGETYRPINKFIKIRKCVNDHIRDESGEIALHMTENHIESTNWVEVIDVADDCRNIKKEHIGLFCIAPEDTEDLARIEYTKEYCLREEAVQFLTTGE